MRWGEGMAGKPKGHLWDKREMLEGAGVNFMECEFYIKKRKKKVRGPGRCLAQAEDAFVLDIGPTPSKTQKLRGARPVGMVPATNFSSFPSSLICGSDPISASKWYSISPGTEGKFVSQGTKKTQGSETWEVRGG